MVFGDEELAVHAVGGVLDQQFVLVAAEDDADGRVVAFDVFLVGEVAEIEVHLADVVVLDFSQLEVDEHETTENAVVEDQVDSIVSVVDGHPVLPADEGEALA